MHPLDTPAWSALTSVQARMGVGDARARRFLPHFTKIGAVADATPDAYEALAQLMEPEEALYLVSHDIALPRALRLVREGMTAQMVYDGSPIERVSGMPIEPLGDADSDAMVALTTLTRPGPFGSRTHEFGGYVGIKRDGELVAMAGQRMAVPGFREVSAVCTHPDHRGRGYAKALMLHVMAGIIARGERPFLHVEDHNVNAKRIYERMGFRQRLAFLLRVACRST
ncbi:MAG TPA: GNAT family N-acetyltransferase [Casimicrobiaceae bacterium]|nr:GNAT family N-acetyltransferase [Casimicrobiaceae bacterium]